ncbi:Mth938-like domain-containing protein [Limnobacter sp.]|uniref:Mth938-like domain-containing protein n=1 Tax=Limnobacter sp. TaxID=2003368 RepID=UPI00351836B1
MKFQPEALDSQFIVQRYDEDGVVISGFIHRQSVVFGSSMPPTPWEATATGGLTLSHCEALHAQCPAGTEVLLIGTGPKQVFPGAEVRRFFASRNCPVEYMDTQAACRTYNILVGEGRQVIAALLI